MPESDFSQLPQLIMHKVLNHLDDKSRVQLSQATWNEHSSYMQYQATFKYLKEVQDTTAYQSLCEKNIFVAMRAIMSDKLRTPDIGKIMAAYDELAIEWEAIENNQGAQAYFDRVIASSDESQAKQVFRRRFVGYQKGSKALLEIMLKSPRYSDALTVQGLLSILEDNPEWDFLAKAIIKREEFTPQVLLARDISTKNLFQNRVLVDHIMKSINFIQVLNSNEMGKIYCYHEHHAKELITRNELIHPGDSENFLAVKESRPRMSEYDTLQALGHHPDLIKPLLEQESFLKLIANTKGSLVALSCANQETARLLLQSKKAMQVFTKIRGIKQWLIVQHLPIDEVIENHMHLIETDGQARADAVEMAVQLKSSLAARALFDRFVYPDWLTFKLASCDVSVARDWMNKLSQNDAFEQKVKLSFYHPEFAYELTDDVLMSIAKQDLVGLSVKYRFMADRLFQNLELWLQLDAYSMTRIATQYFPIALSVFNSPLMRAQVSPTCLRKLAETDPKLLHLYKNLFGEIPSYSPVVRLMEPYRINQLERARTLLFGYKASAEHQCKPEKIVRKLGIPVKR